MTNEKSKYSRTNVQEGNIPIQEAYNPNRIIAARGKQPPTENTNTQN